jgi:D-alanine--poly(phosphoribitol) ligase subunit 1
MHNITKRDFNKIRKGDYTSIGKSHPLMQLVLLNIKNKLISKSNEVGELVMLGKSVSMGYFDDSVETKKKYFIFDGKPAFKTGDIGYRDKNNNFYILGRNDNLVKIHGYRIDLNEIEKTISHLPNVYTTSVFVNKISSDHNELWAAIELEKKDKKLNIFEIKKKLRKLLPNYMVPKRLFTIPKIPLTSNGKLDKKKLLKYINQNLT